MAQRLSRRSLWLNRIAEEVARGLRQRIEGGALAIDAEIPSREALAAEFVTTLGTVDRALSMLIDEGWLNESDSGGLRVARTAITEQAFELPEDFDATRDDVIAVLELRMGVESVAAALAASRRDEAALADLQDARAAFEAAVAAREGAARADYRFHHAVARASGNRYIVELLEYLGPLLIPRMRVTIDSEDGGRRDANLGASAADHRRIVEAIAAGDETGARDAMREHLLRSIRLIASLEDGSGSGPNASLTAPRPEVSR